MKKLNSIWVIFFVSAFTGIAQTQTVTLTATNSQPSSYNCITNQIISINSFISDPDQNISGAATISFYNGLNSRIKSSAYGLTHNNFSSSVFNGSAVFTGVTNILVSTDGDAAVSLTFTITTPTTQSILL